jgi:hypothetical protein
MRQKTFIEGFSQIHRTKIFIDMDSIIAVRELPDKKNTDGFKKRLVVTTDIVLSGKTLEVTISNNERSYNLVIEYISTRNIDNEKDRETIMFLRRYGYTY